MTTYQPTIQDITASSYDRVSRSGAGTERLPYYVALPMIGMMSVGLWIGVYKIGCYFVGLLA